MTPALALAASAALGNPRAVAAAYEYEQARIEFGDEVCRRLLHRCQTTGYSFAELLKEHRLLVAFVEEHPAKEAAGPWLTPNLRRGRRLVSWRFRRASQAEA